MLLLFRLHPSPRDDHQTYICRDLKIAPAGGFVHDSEKCKGAGSGIGWAE